MSYFNHSFQKVFLATKTGTQTEVKADDKITTAGVQDGILTSVGIPVYDLKNEKIGLGKGVVGIFDKKTNLSVAGATIAASGDKFFIAASSLMTNDKIGPFHGGYAVEDKSKDINPRFISKVWKVVANEAITPKKSIGAQWGTDEEGAAKLVVCSKDFYCGEHYHIRIDVKGTSALRFANHQLYRTFTAYGGCCTGETATTVDAGYIYKQWAEQINEDNYLKDFVRAFIVADGKTYAQTAEDIEIAGLENALLFDALPETTTECYMILLGAYEDTQFGNCSFQPSDYYGKEPIMIYASEVDLKGDPCAFEGLCVDDICLGVQANGLGEQKLREVFLNESYLQKHVATDPRIREITQGDDILNSIDRKGLYDVVYLQHSVPRYSNPTSVYDNDRYVLEIIMPHSQTGGVAELEKQLIPVVEAWSDAEIETSESGDKSFVDYTSQSTCEFTFPGEE